MKVIDLSKNNIVTDWEAVRASGVDACILKIIRRDNNIEESFLSHLSGARSVNLPVVGVYNYLYATTVEEAKQAALFVINYLNSVNLVCPVWLDLEYSGLMGLGHKLVEIIKAYGDICTSFGIEFGIYTYQGFYQNNITKYALELPYPLWIARYYKDKEIMDISVDPDNSKCPVFPNVVAWQYTSHGRANGINGYVDISTLYYDPFESTDLVQDHVKDPDPVPELTKDPDQVPEYVEKQLFKNIVLSTLSTISEIQILLDRYTAALEEVIK